MLHQYEIKQKIEESKDKELNQVSDLELAKMIVLEARRHLFVGTASDYTGHEKSGRLVRHIGNSVRFLVTDLIEKFAKLNKPLADTLIAAAIEEMGFGNGHELALLVAIKLLQKHCKSEIHLIMTDMHREENDHTYLILGKLKHKGKKIKSLIHKDHADLIIVDPWENIVSTIGNVLKTPELRKIYIEEVESLDKIEKIGQSILKFYPIAKAKLAERVRAFYKNSILEDITNPLIGRCKYDLPLQENGWELDPLRTLFKDNGKESYACSSSPYSFSYNINGKKALEFLYNAFDNGLKESNKAIVASVGAMLGYIIKEINLDKRKECVLAAMPKPLALFFLARSIYASDKKDATALFLEAYKESDSLYPEIQTYIKANLEQIPALKEALAGQDAGEKKSKDKP